MTNAHQSTKRTKNANKPSFVVFVSFVDGRGAA